MPFIIGCVALSVTGRRIEETDLAVNDDESARTSFLQRARAIERTRYIRVNGASGCAYCAIPGALGLAAGDGSTFIHTGLPPLLATPQWHKAAQNLRAKACQQKPVETPQCKKRLGGVARFCGDLVVSGERERATT
eukprot:5171403-Pyramimonas_sp.AAC.1